ncbi:MAG: hypothetical protein OXM01_07355 [Gemmatimonadota bacterium]|nr:hypothetical protein [Gemmatimonadota bacterium]
MQQATLPAPRWQSPTTRSTPPNPTPSSTAQTAARSAVLCEQLAQRCEATADALAADALAVLYWRDEAARWWRHAADWDARVDRLRAPQAGTP